MMSTGKADAEAPTAVRAALGLEEARALDPARRLLQPAADVLIGSPTRREALQGIWLGHALHPVLTDLPVGAWASATVLDLFGGEESRPAARKLVAFGLLAAVPTAITGLAEWAVIGEREQRVGVVHAAANTVALMAYTASLAQRRRNRHAAGVTLALGGSLAMSIGGYLGGHLAGARRVSSRHPLFEDDL